MGEFGWLVLAASVESSFEGRRTGRCQTLPFLPQVGRYPGRELASQRCAVGGANRFIQEVTSQLVASKLRLSSFRPLSPAKFDHEGASSTANFLRRGSTASKPTS